MEWLVYIANGMYLLSYYMKDILRLRIFTVAAAICLTTYFYFRPEPMMTVVYWNLFFVALNVYQIVRIVGLQIPKRKDVSVGTADGKRIALAAVLLVSLAAPAWAGIDEGVAAYKRGDYKLALQEWTPLAEQGHANAQYLIGEMYHEGVGVPQDNAASAIWILRAAEQGHGDAQYLIGQMYHGGLGVPLDYAEAALWYRRAGEQGNPGCQFILGFLYRTGQGVPKDFVQAHFWFSVSAAQGSDASRKSRERVAKKMTPAQIAEAQRLAREWMEKRRGK